MWQGISGDVKVERVVGKECVRSGVDSGSTRRSAACKQRPDEQIGLGREDDVGGRLGILTKGIFGS